MRRWEEVGETGGGRQGETGKLSGRGSNRLGQHLIRETDKKTLLRIINDK